MTVDFDQTISMARRVASIEELHAEAIKQFLYMCPVMSYIKDYSGDVGVYVFVSREWERTYGIKKTQVIGKTDHDFFPKPQADRFRLNDLHALEFEKTVTVVDYVGTRYSNWRPIKMALLPMQIGPGTKWNYVAGMHLPNMVTIDD
jgi:hypothetical protein